MSAKREELKEFIVQNTYSHDMPCHLLREGETWRDFREISQDEYPAVVDEYLDAYRAEVLREALAAISGEQLSDRTGTPEDEAYSGGISDAHRAVMALIYP